MTEEMVKGVEPEVWDQIAKGTPPPRGMGHPTADQVRLHDVLQRRAEAKAKGEVPSTADEVAYQYGIQQGLIVSDVHEETGHEAIVAGFADVEIKRQEAIAEAMKELEGLSVEAVKMRRKPAWHDFREKRAAAIRTKELETKFDLSVKALYGDRMGEVRDKDFKVLVDQHVATLKKAFSEPLKESE